MEQSRFSRFPPAFAGRNKESAKKYNSIESKYTIKLQTIYIFKGPVSNGHNVHDGFAKPQARYGLVKG